MKEQILIQLHTFFLPVLFFICSFSCVSQSPLKLLKDKVCSVCSKPFYIFNIPGVTRRAELTHQKVYVNLPMGLILHLFLLVITSLAYQLSYNLAKVFLVFQQLISHLVVKITNDADIDEGLDLNSLV
jgi:hypothetical protein